MGRILITGASGLLGWHTALSLRGRVETYGTYYRNLIEIKGCTLFRLDITDGEGVGTLLQEIRPDVIVHTAVLGDVDRCEQGPDEAHRVNVGGTEHLARGAARIGARLIYISTDLVYDGTKGYYAEDDQPRPLNVYAQTKLEGERRAAAFCKNSLVLRLALLYGWGNGLRKSFTDWLFERLAQNQEVRLFTDQYRTPLLVDQAAEGIGRIVEEPGIRGLFHLGGGKRLSRYEFGLKFCEAFGFAKELLKPIRMEEFGYLARRPKDCSLNSQKLAALLGVRLLSVEEGLRKMRASSGGRLRSGL